MDADVTNRCIRREVDFDHGVGEVTDAGSSVGLDQGYLGASAGSYENSRIPHAFGTDRMLDLDGGLHDHARRHVDPKTVIEKDRVEGGKVFGRAGEIELALEKLGLGFEHGLHAADDDTLGQRGAELRCVGPPPEQISFDDGADGREPPCLGLVCRKTSASKRIGRTTAKRAKPLRPRLEGLGKISQERLACSVGHGLLASRTSL